MFTLFEITISFGIKSPLNVFDKEGCKPFIISMKG